MAKKPISQKRAEREKQENLTLQRVFNVFLLGIAAECYLFVVYRNYVMGTAASLLVWYNILRWAAIAGVVALVVYQNESFQYAGFLIYIMAMYAFYTTVMAIVNLVRYRQFQSPVMSAARTVNLVAAMVSMLSLETAMLSRFGGGEDFRRMMTGATGWSVCAAVVGMGAFMMIHSSRQLIKMKSSHFETD